ncbi:class I adenylate-forming enzyme family protein [Cypionkella sp.]|uniref:class I adenylate-forming enzyme family protein n=1 Tax=Cypionkella sp. TaxID=2811411 RepID=UPI002619290A|nr:class I adenylate-forming enzyme family protein [Cypionkella sp.]MDB5663803.1 long-chain fatty acid--CoA ligase [Cypionkella sp.]
MTTALDGILLSLDTDPEKIRVEYRGRGFTGAQLRGRIAARAADLQHAGLRQGDMALVIVSDNLSAIEQLLACWVLGAGGTLVDFRTPSSRIDEWRQRLQPALVVGTREVLGQAVHAQPRDLAPVTATPLHSALPTHVAPEHLAICVSSSGTTGLPSLTDVTQGRLGWILETLNADAQAVRDGTFLSALSVGFSASCYIWLRLLLSGRKILALDLIHRITELDAALKRTDVVECGLSPTAIRQLCALPMDNIPRYPQLVRLASVGGPARPEDKVAAVGKLSPAYSMNYSCIGVGLVSRITGVEILERPASCGKLEPTVILEICDGDRKCGPGEIGEILISTPRLSGHRPGDLGWLDADGYLYVTGRVQGLLSRNGVNFSAERLVATALACPDVVDASVVALKDSDDGDEVHLVVQTDPSAVHRIKAAFAAHLRSRLAAAEYPDRLHVWTELPLTAGGKVDSRALTQMVREALHDTRTA